MTAAERLEAIRKLVTDSTAWHSMLCNVDLGHCTCGYDQFTELLFPKEES